MHAQVRRLLQGSPRWDSGAWGTPINQLDMAGTVLLFSLVVVDGLRRFGFKFSAEEVSDVLHLWRTAGFLLGVREDLLSSTETEAREVWDLIRLTQGPPDADSAELAQALVESPLHEARTAAERSRAEGVVGLGYGLSRFLLEDGYADALGLPKNGWRFVVPALRGLVSTAGRVLGRLPGSERLRLEAGLLYWRHVVSVGLKDGGRHLRPARGPEERLTSTGVVVHQGQHVIQVEGLADEAHHHPLAPRHLFHLGVGGNEEDMHSVLVRTTGELLQEGEAAHDGHHQVQKDKARGGHPVQHRQRLAAVGGGQDTVPAGVEHLLEHLPDVRVVLHHQHHLGRGDHLLSSLCPRPGYFFLRP